MSDREGSKRSFDLTFNLGHVIILTMSAAGFVGTHYVSAWRLDTLEKQNLAIQAKLDGFTNLLIDAAVTAQRMREFERRLEIAERH